MAGGRMGFRRLIGLVLAGWAAEAIHYTALIVSKGVGAPGVSAAEMYLRVFVAGLPADLARVLLFMGGLWLSAWLAGFRMDGRLCLEASAYASLVLGAAMAAASPLAWLLSVEEAANVAAVVAIAAAAAGLAWGAKRLGVRVETWRLVAASVFASLLVHLSPAVLATPMARFYGFVYGQLHPRVG